MHAPQMVHKMVLSGKATLTSLRLLACATAATSCSIGAVEAHGGKVNFHMSLQVVVAREFAGTPGVQADVGFGG